MTVLDIYSFLDSFAPFSSAAPWDNSGLLIGSFDAQVSTVYVCLDVTDRTLREAIACGADLIVSHHPVIFQPLRQIKTGSVQAELIQSRISVISAHTNLDKAQGGVNDTLCELFDSAYQKADNTADGFLNILSVPSMEPEQFALLVKEKLNTRVSFLAGSSAVSRIGVCSGSGGDFIRDAASLGCDGFLTGEASHHAYLDAATCGVTLFTAGHYETEIPFAAALSSRMQAALQSVRFVAERPVSFLTVI